MRNWNSSTSAMETLREYRFTYSAMAASGGDGKQVRLLQSITEYGRGAASSLPATTFQYTAYDSKVHCTGCGTWKEQSFPYERLSSIANGYGLVTTASYNTPDAPKANDTTYDRTYNYRVAQTNTSDTGGVGNRMAYSYPSVNSQRGYDNNSVAGCDFFAAGETTGGTLVGYQFVTETLQTSEGGTDVSLATHEFKLDADYSADIRRGHELQTWQKSPATPTPVTLVRTVNDWQKTLSLEDTSGLRAYPVAKCYFVYPATVSEYWYEPNEPVVPQKKTEYVFWLQLNTRQYRNEADYVHLDRLKEYDSNTLIRETDSDYLVNLGLDGNGVSPNGPWITDLLCQQLLKNGGGTTVAGSRYVYDSQANTYTSTPTRGDLVRTEGLRANTSDWIITERMTHTLYTANNESFWYGPTEISDARGNKTQYAYSTAWRLYPETATNAATHVTTTSWDYVRGQPSYVQGPNGVDTRISYEYDDFGRLKKVIKPYDSSSYPTTAFYYNDGTAPWSIRQEDRQTAGSASVLRTFRFYSGQGQLIQEKAANTGQSAMIVTSQAYNAQGLVATQWEPLETGYSTSYVTPSGSSTALSYDALGRAKQVTRPDSTRVRTGYDGLDYAVVDENSRQRLYQGDGLGRITAIKEYVQSFLWPDPNTGQTPYAITSYDYNELDQLTVVTDTLGNIITMSYDLAGRKTAMSDPDMGTWSYAYDNAGNLISQIDARGQRTCLYYDGLNRLTGKSYDCGLGDCPDEPQDVVLSYDYYASPSYYGIGYVHKITETAESLVTSYAYDARGRKWGSWQTTDVTERLRTQWGYDSYDIMITTRYPGGCIIRAMLTIDSDGCRPPILGHADHLFRHMASSFSWRPESVVALVRNPWTACSGIRRCMPDPASYSTPTSGAG